MNMTATLPAQTLTFARSESKTIGVGGGLMDMLRDNSARVVGTLKLAGDLTIGLGSGLMIGYSLFAGIGRLLMIAFGTKANQKEVAASYVGKLYPKASPLDKLMHPREYPVEAAAGMSVIGECFTVAYALSTGTFTPLILGLAAIWSYGNILLGKEEKKTEAPASEKMGENPSLVFATSQSKPVGWFGEIREKMKGNPVFTSSIFNIAISMAMIVGGIAESTLKPSYAISGGIYLIANIIQACLVRKNEFNVEGALGKENVQPRPDSFAERFIASSHLQPSHTHLR